jgi:oxygen-independent coproporphyrinogen-3 oxidase
MREIALYIHVPFCIQKCRYCDFVSYPYLQPESISDYFKVLTQELQIRTENDKLQSVVLKSIYFGGGTPSLVSPEILNDFLLLLRQNFRFSESIEITVEANPGTLNSEKIREFAHLGVNRLSIGIQSFQNRFLSFLGRAYREKEVHNLLTELIDTGLFLNWSFDLMYGLPFQTFSDWKKEMEHLLMYQPPHFSLYNLTLSHQVPLRIFLKKHFALFPGQDWEASIYRWTQQILRKYGYRRYEISNFAKPGYECLHNLTYWRNQEYLGLGVSSSSYLGGIRMRNASTLSHYQKRIKNCQSPVVTKDILNLKQKLAEEMILALRTSEGVETEKLFKTYPESLVQEKLIQLEDFAQSHFIHEREGRWILTSRGTLIANQLFLEILD